MNATLQRSRRKAFTLVEILFTIIGTMVLALAFTGIVALQTNMENLAIARLTAFRRATHGAQSVTNLMRDGHAVLEHGSDNDLTVNSPLAPGSTLDNRVYTFEPSLDFPLRWRDARIGKEATYEVFFDKAQNLLWISKEFDSPASGVDQVVPLARGVSRVEVRLGVNPEAGDPSGALAEPSEYCEIEVEVKFKQGTLTSTVWVSSGAYLRDPVQ